MIGKTRRCAQAIMDRNDGKLVMKELIQVVLKVILRGGDYLLGGREPEDPIAWQNLIQKMLIIAMENQEKI